MTEQTDKEKNKTIHLILKNKWFDMIKEGKKTREYRDLKRWIWRLIFKDKMKGDSTADEIEQFFKNRIKKMREELYKNMPELSDVATTILSFGFEDRSIYRYSTVTFHRGYSKTTLTYPIRKIYIGEGDTELGAEEGKMYIIIDFSKDDD